MTVHESKELAKGAGLVVVHVAAIAVGFILMMLGIGLGVGLVTLPVAIPIGFAGLFVFLWGLFGRSTARETPLGPPGQS
jgi:hypothetical protein